MLRTECSETKTWPGLGAALLAAAFVANPVPFGWTAARADEGCSCSSATSAGDGVLPVTKRVSLEGLEVIQSVQDVSHSVPILESRPTMVRAYLSVETATGYGVLEGEIKVTRLGDGSTVVVPSTRPAYVWDHWNGKWKSFKRKHLNASLNFELPAGSLTPGDYLVGINTVTDRVRSGAAVGCADCCGMVRRYSIVSAAPLRLRVVGIAYEQGGVMHRPTPVDYRSIDSWLVRTFPASAVEYTTSLVVWDEPVPFAADDANALIREVRVLDIDVGVDCRTHYYGLVHDGGFYFGGKGTIPVVPDPAAVASGPAGTPLPSRHSWDDDSSYADSYAGHELGHTLGQRHVGGACGEAGVNHDYPFPMGRLSCSDPDLAFVGLDRGDPTLGVPARVLDGSLWHDALSYCPFRWVSSYTYGRIRDQLAAEDLLTCDSSLSVTRSGEFRHVSPAPAAGAVTGEALKVVLGVVNLDAAAGRITSIIDVRRASRGKPGSRAKFRVYFRAGLPLEVAAAEYVQSDGKAVVSGLFPDLGAIERIDLYLDGRKIDGRVASAAPPTFAEAQTAGIYREGRLETLEWRASDADGDALRYTVQVLGDSRSSKTILVNSTRNSLDVAHLGQADDAKDVRFRIRVTDGLHTAETTKRLPMHAGENR